METNDRSYNFFRSQITSSRQLVIKLNFCFSARYRSLHFLQVYETIADIFLES